MTLTTSASIASARTLLFVPADRPERYAKAAASGADLVCIDLEDAVAPAARAQARVSLMSFLKAQAQGHPFGLRINPWGSADGLRDVLALREVFAPPDAAPNPAFVMLAKTQCANDVALLAEHLPGLPLVALIESAQGLHAAADIAGASAQLRALMFGGADMAADLACAFTWEPLLHARCTVVAAAARHGLASFDVPWLDVADPAGAAAEALRAVQLGFTGKGLIHPSQVAPVHSALQPTPEALARAQRVVRALAQAMGQAVGQAVGQGAVLVDGRMVDRPVLLAAQRLLRRAGVPV